MKSVFLIGTTASGKTDWAVKSAQGLGGCIVNCDSIQTYDKLEIGSAQPSEAQKQTVPHYLFSYTKPPSEMTAGIYRRNHLDLLQEVSTTAFVVGGTGFYFQAIEKGMYEAPPASQKEQLQIEEVLTQENGEDILWQELHEKDPETAAKIHKHDHYRLVRAIELIRREGKKLSDIRKHLASQPPNYPRPYKKFGIHWEKSELDKRIFARTQKMLANGLIEETKSLLDQGLELWAPMESVGYRECIVFLRENKTKEWLLQEIIGSTQRLAKKQRTWFQRDAEIQWFSGDGGWPLFDEKVRSFLET